MKIRIKRVYELPGKHDGRRILVDRLWPRGLTKEQAGALICGSKISPPAQSYGFGLATNRTGGRRSRKGISLNSKAIADRSSY
jgi:hypothetical protein